MRHIFRVPAAFVAVALLANCGGDDVSSSAGAAEERLSDAIAEQMLADDSDSLGMTEADVRCVSDGVVDRVGVDALADAGLTDEAVRSGAAPEDADLPDDVVDDFVDVFVGCVDVADVMVAGITEELDISDDSAECLADGLSDFEDVMRRAARSGITGEEFDPTEDADFTAAMFSLMGDCLSAEELQQLAS